MPSCVYIISGIPGAGKTTVSRLLARRLERSACLESDWLQEIVISGGVWPNEEPQDEAMRQLRLRAKNCCMLADSFFEAAFTPVIDDVVIGWTTLWPTCARGQYDSSCWPHAPKS